MTKVQVPQQACPISLVFILIVAVAGGVGQAQAVPLTADGQVVTELLSPRVRQVMGRRGVDLVQDLAVAGQILVRLDATVTPEELNELLGRNNCRVLHRYGRHPLYVIGLPGGQTVNDAVSQWGAQPGVKFAEPDRLMYRTIMPNDPRYTEQYQWAITSAPQAWDYQQGSASTVIAIVDSGVQLDHPDLQSKIWTNTGEIADNGVDDDFNGLIDDVYGWDFWNDNNDSNPELPEDPGSYGDMIVEVAHGTHCAGLAAAATNNFVGVAGYDWQAQIMAIQVFPPVGGSPSSLIMKGFQYAVYNGADIINLSLGGWYEESWTDVITEAFELGIVVVAAAGNYAWEFTDDPYSWDSPVCNDGPFFTDNHVLGVAATDENDEAAWFTNRDVSSRNFVDVCAPGVGILSTWAYFPGVEWLDVEYDLMSGTSMSTPIAVGLCGLLRAEYPSAGAEGIIRQIRLGSDNIDDKNPLYAGTLGQGRINGVNSLTDQPPSPPRSVMAYDTPGDEGGSITVSWRLSRDDGRGFDDVIGYEVHKSDAYDGTFTKIGDVPAGTTSYVDEPVPDGVSFYYKVAVLDASHTVESSVVGPAAARDDLPPDAVTDLEAVDTPNDDGGCISLNWVGYQGPSDFEKFRIYRATGSFADVSGMTPIHEISSITRQTYVDRSVTDGVGYWYAVTAADDTDNEEQTATAVGPVVAYPNFSFDYPAGLNMICIGARPPTGDMAEVLGVDPAELKLARWDPVAEAYQTYDPANPTDPAVSHQLGRGFWLRHATALTVDIAGLPAPPGDYEISLVPGWNMIGNPYSTDMDFTTAKIIVGGTEYDLETSNQKRYTSDYAWGFDGAANSYELITGAFPFGTPTIAKGRGVFLLSWVTAKMKLTRPVGALAVPRPPVQRTAPTPDNWHLQLVARGAGTADVDNFLGVSPQAVELSQVVSPPSAQPGVELCFTTGEQPDVRRALDFVTSLSSRSAWEVTTACSVPGTEVEISWPDLSTLPSDLKPVLTDLASGQSVYLRTTSSYRYQAAEAGTRRFTLTVSGGEGALHLNSVTTAATPTGGAQVAFSLSAPAQVSVEILNISGRRVQQVMADRAYPAGVGQIVWNGRNAGGAPAPAGTYLVRVTAQTETGQQVTALRSVSIRR